MRIGFGPVTSLPSWKWVGEDTSKELSKHHEVVQYSSFQEVPPCDVLFVIKQMPSPVFVQAAHHYGMKVVYVPIDFFTTRNSVKMQGNELNKLDLILSHSARLMPLFSRYAETRYIDHNGKFFLDEMAPYKEDGYVLWIGGFQFVPYLLLYLSHHHIDEEIKILADYRNPAAIRCAETFAGLIRLPKMKIEGNSVNGYQLYDWSEELQKKMLQEAKAAIDIKGQDFHQMHKPPTKAQKFVCSGVPFAINEESEAFVYFKDLGFNVCLPTDTDRWFSRDYWEETATFGQSLREDLSLESIGKKYNDYIEEIT